MLGRKDYTRDEVVRCEQAIAARIDAYRKLAETVAATSTNGASPLEELEPLYFNDLILVLDRYFVHRVRMVAGKDGNPLNEVELLADSLMSNGGVLRASSVIKYVPEESVLKLRIGDPIRPTAADFERLANAFLAEIRERFLARA